VTAIVGTAIIAAVVLLSVALSRVEMSRITPLVFHCKQCATDFAQPPHLPFPTECPRCHARDWSR